MSFFRLYFLATSPLDNKKQKTNGEEICISGAKRKIRNRQCRHLIHTKCFLSNIYWDVEFGFLNSIEDGLKRIGECYMESVLRNIELSTVYILGRIADTETHSITGWKPWKISIAASCNALLLYSIFVVIRSCFN